MKVIAFVPDLMDRSRFGQVPADVEFVTSPEGLSAAAERDDKPEMAVADLGRPGAIEALATMSASGINTVGFVSHVNQERIAEARDAGIGEVLPRSQFFRRIAAIVGVTDH